MNKLEENMKRILVLLIATAFVAFSCSKDKKLSKRIDGDWNIAKLDYSGSVPIPGAPFPFPVNSTASNAGSMTFKDSDKTCTYSIKFTPVIPGFGITLPEVAFEGSGKYTNDDETVTITNTDGQVLVFNIEVNEKTKQVWNTTSNFEFTGLGQIPVTLKAEMTKK